MYIRHKAEGAIVFTLTVILSLITKVSYNDLSATALTVVSISVAVYIAAMSSLLGSPYASKISSIADSWIKGKSQLGVLTTYLRIAGNCGVLTIIISILYQIPSVIKIPVFLSRLTSAIACGIFAINIYFLWLVFHFLSVALINSARNSSS